MAERVWAAALFLLLIAVLVVTRYHGSWFWYGTANFLGGALFGGWMKNRGDGDE